MTTVRKLNALSIEKKVKILEYVTANPDQSKKDIASIFGIPASTLSTIVKNGPEICKQFYAGDTRKRKRNVEFPDLEAATIKWFVQCRDNNISVSGSLLRERAEIFAQKLGYVNFKASNGWLEKFKNRHGITFRQVCGESADVNKEVCDDWKSSLHTITQGYGLNDIFNADETGSIIFIVKVFIAKCLINHFTKNQFLL